MPFFDFDPIDPELELRGDLGPGRENRLDDRIKLASAIEKKTGGAPHAELGRYGETLARRLTGQSDGRSRRRRPTRRAQGQRPLARFPRRRRRGPDSAWDRS